MLYLQMCYLLAFILMIVIINEQSYLKAIDWLFLLLSPVTIPTYIIYFILKNYKN